MTNGKARKTAGIKALVLALAAAVACSSLQGCSAQSAPDSKPAPSSQETMVSYDLSTSSKDLDMSFGGVRVNIHGKRDASGSDYVDLSAVIRFPDGKIQIADLGAGPIYAKREVWIGKLSQADAAPSVAFSNESGGNRCCSELTIVTRAYGDYTSVPVELIFGRNLTSSFIDLNGDGIKDIITFDPTFLGGFIDSGVGAYHLPKVVNVIKGQVIDISKDPMLKDYWSKTQALAAKDCADPELSENDGACATYVAIGARLGYVDESIKFAVTHLRPRESPYYACTYRTSTFDECPAADRREFYDFATAIKFALEVFGYT